MNQQTKIYIAGHRGLASSVVVWALQRQDYANLVWRTHAELDQDYAAAAQNFFDQHLSKPEGTLRKLSDVTKISELGWQAKTGLKEGIRSTYQTFGGN